MRNTLLLTTVSSIFDMSMSNNSHASLTSLENALEEQDHPGVSKKISINDLTWDMHNFVTKKGWYNSDSTRQQTPRNIAISLSLEAAEILEHFQWDDWVDAPTNKKSLAGELADVSLYLFQLASLTGIDLEIAIQDKLKENENREWDN
jgi:NTP pyrophosphatase (non-canonical NTP hydrolase)